MNEIVILGFAYKNAFEYFYRTIFENSAKFIN